MASLADLGQIKPFDANAFIQAGQAGQRQRTLADLGQYAAKGDYGNAAAAAFSGGQTDIGAQLAQMSTQQHQQLVQDAASLAQGADTPEKWDAAGKQFTAAHPGVTWPPFAARNVVINQALSAQDQINNRFKEEELANSRATAAAAANKAPNGYRWNAAGTALEAIPGGPGDASVMSPDALHLIAAQYLAGDKSAVVGFARNPAMKAQIMNEIAKQASDMGLDGPAVAAQFSAYAGNVAGQRAAGTRAAQVGMAAGEANQMADLALSASNAVPRGSFLPWNKAMQAVQTGTSSPEMARFVTATTSLVNAYARAVSPLGAPTDAMRQHAEAMLNTAQGPEAYAAVIDQMKSEMEAALNAPAEISSQLKASVAGGDGTTGAPAAGNGPQPGAVEDGYRFKGGDPSDQNNWEPVQ